MKCNWWLESQQSDQEANQAVGDGEGGDQVVGGRVKTPLLLIMIMIMIMRIMMIMMIMMIIIDDYYLGGNDEILQN